MRKIDLRLWKKLVRKVVYIDLWGELSREILDCLNTDKINLVISQIEGVYVIRIPVGFRSDKIR